MTFKESFRRKESLLFYYITEVIFYDFIDNVRTGNDGVVGYTFECCVPTGNQS